MYADDIVLYCSHRNPRLAVNCMQVDLNKVSQWCDDNSMTINENKTKAMWFTSMCNRKKIQDLSLSINNVKLGEVDHYKYLGVDLDMDLNLTKYVNNTVSKMGNRVFKLGRLRVTVPEYTAITVYKQTILPVVDYGCFLAESARRNPSEKFQVLQNQGLRICLKKRVRDINIEELHCRTEVPLLVNRRKELLASMMFRKKKKVHPAIKVRSTRSDGKFIFPTRRTTSAMGAKSPYNRGVALWDKLPVEVQNCKTKVAFKTATKKIYGNDMKRQRKLYFQRIQRN